MLARLWRGVWLIEYGVWRLELRVWRMVKPAIWRLPRFLWSLAMTDNKKGQVACNDQQQKNDLQ